MASTTAEVLLYFGVDDEKFKKSVDTLRFTLGVDDSQAIIDILGPVWSLGYSDGYDEGLADGSD